jgi:RNA polymerase sigma-70 factor (ECF subfamily)
MILAAFMHRDELGPIEESITRLRRGDAAALGKVMGHYQHRLYRFLVRLVQDPFAADDLFQQTWIRIMEKIGSYDARHPFDPWMFSVARNLTIDYLRKRRAVSLDAPDDVGIAPSSRLTASGPDPLEQILEQERGTILAAAIAELPVIHREILTLRFEEAMKLEEIATVAGIPLSTVKSRLLRALESLRGRLQSR